MITITKIAKAVQRFFEATAKARVNSTLLGMGREKVEQLGYSYEALRAGPSAWPWRKTTYNSAATGEIGAQVRGLNDPDTFSTYWLIVCISLLCRNSSLSDIKSPYSLRACLNRARVDR